MERLIIENFRNIENKIDLDLAAVTIFTGANFSGKSNILKLLTLLSDYFYSDNHFVLSFNGPNSIKHKIDCYQNAVNWKNWNENKSLKFSYVRNNYFISFEFEPDPTQKGQNEIQDGKLKMFEIIDKNTETKLSINNVSGNEYEFCSDIPFLINIQDFDPLQDPGHRIEDLREREASLLKEIMNLKSENKKLGGGIDSTQDKERTLQIIRFTIEDLELAKLMANDQIKYSTRFGIDEGRFKSMKLHRVIRDVLQKWVESVEFQAGKYAKMRNWDAFISSVPSGIEKFVSIKTVLLSPDRSHQMRIQMNSDKSSEMSQIISSFSDSPLASGSPGDIFLKRWMKQFGIGDNYRIRSIKGIANSIEIEKDGDWRNLVDMGFGVGQLFPIILRLAEFLQKYNKDLRKFRKLDVNNYAPFFIIEEPESNLHPAFQSLLARMFFEFTKDKYVRILIETHSEYMIRKTQSIVKEISPFNSRRLNPFTVYYLGPEGPYKMEYRDDGRFSNKFGPGFFDETINLISDIL